MSKEEALVIVICLGRKLQQGVFFEEKERALYHAALEILEEYYIDILSKN